jgi:alkanesulfonate monooxygenase SsuD/methylene tetrahydromethanopterin reductase-like flavin-dependent oxidoreductase (luciferase family)
MATAQVGMVFDYEAFPAAAIGECARRCESAGIDQLLVVEDCFHTASASLAGAALAVTEQLTIGIGIMPAVARNPAITAMEIATLANIGPGRLIAGIGHGIPEWMDRIGARPQSPLTTLEETLTVVKQLLAGQEVTFDGHHVHLDAVRLDQPPATVPPVLAGVAQPKSLALAGRVADGVILAYSGPTYVASSLEHTGRPDGFRVSTDTVMSVAAERREAYLPLCDFLADLTLARWPSLTVLPFFDEMLSKVADGGADALMAMPAEYWREIGAIGTIDDALDHVAALDAVGVECVNVFSGRKLDDSWDLIPIVAQLARR